MKYNILKITTIYSILIVSASLTMIACPKPDKSTWLTVMQDRITQSAYNR